MIKTTHGKTYSAFIALSQIRGMVRGMDALHVFHFKTVLQESVDFLTEEEMRLVQEADGIITGTGTVIIPDKAKREQYLTERKKLDELPCEIPADPITIRIDKCPDVTAEQIEMLDGFVIFTEGVESDGDK